MQWTKITNRLNGWTMLHFWCFVNDLEENSTWLEDTYLLGEMKGRLPRMHGLIGGSARSIQRRSTWTHFSQWFFRTYQIIAYTRVHSHRFSLQRSFPLWNVCYLEISSKVDLGQSWKYERANFMCYATHFLNLRQGHITLEEAHDLRPLSSTEVWFMI
jgi:hypothetical protein